MSITLTAADSISYPEYPNEYFSVPNDRIGTCLRDGEGLMRDGCKIDVSSVMGMPSCGVIPAFDVTLASSGISKALTYDENKPMLAYLPTAALREMAKVQDYGQKKYGTFWNYRKGLEVGRNLSCALRHIYEVMDGNDVDNESGAHHLGHAMVRLAFVLQNLKDGTAIDDRYAGNNPDQTPEGQRHGGCL